MINLGKVHIGLRVAAITVFGLLPFFFVSIYLFKYELIARIDGNPLGDIDFYFIVSLCFAFSITWFVLASVGGSYTVKVHDIIHKVKSQQTEKYAAAVLYSVMYLCLSILINSYAHFSFRTFVLMAYSYLLLRAILLTIHYGILRRARIKKYADLVSERLKENLADAPKK